MHASFDADILDACRRGDRAAFNQLVRTYQDLVYRTVLRLVRDPDDAWDIAQDVFVRAFEKVGDFRGESQVSTWLYRIAVNLSLNHLRRSRLRTYLRLDEAQHALPSDTRPPSEELERSEMQQLIDRAIETLPPKQKAVFTLRYHEELPYEQIAAVLRTSVGGLKANYHHALKKIEIYVRTHM
ncbi:MAG: sigma-70 family RNA polymerase sigma factor [Bacteroidota bacterium]|jgi:RNA polymerase sigma-70 factor (ECF subfamily)|nr:sigma-70 family RNA polymerase sigma factor [Bacteroidota bacterium]